MRTVSIGINRRCPLRCKHCSVGFSETYHGDKGEIDLGVLESVIAQLDPRTYEMVLLVGGEPSLSPALIRAAIAGCKARGLLCAIATAPVWARTPAAAERFLSSVPGLDIQILSYDDYHLESLTFMEYLRATVAARDRGVGTVVHVTHSTDEERDRLLSSLAILDGSLLQISTMRTVPVGNAALPGNVHFDQVRVDSVADLKRIPRGCVAGNAFIDERQGVHGCCWSVACRHSPITVPAHAPAPVGARLESLESREVFEVLRSRGLVDGLTERGKALVAARLGGRSFANECHLCVALMNEENRAIWEECRVGVQTQ